MITATKNGIIRNFSKMQWGNMPKDKFGWTAISEAEAQIVNPNIIQKKMVAGAVVATKVVPDEIIKSKTMDLEISRLGPLSDIPEVLNEIGGRPDDSEVGEQLNLDNAIPEIKRKPGRPSR